jgi:autotransporter strand-loop-strand O-heptosyltransferase
VKLKILYIEPHLSTGGAPQFALKRIQSLQKFKNEIEIFLVEYSNFSETYVVQRNEIIKLLGEEHFFTLGGTGEIERKYGLIDIIKNNKIDVIHSEEMLDGFEAFNRIPLDLLNQIYSNDRSWRIVETCHNIWYDPKTNKKLQPEAYSLVTPYHMDNTFKSTKPMKRLSLYPFENKVNSLLEEYGTIKGVNTVPLIHKLKIRDELGLDLMKTHVLNVGLWTSGKNQGEGVEVARTLVESNPNIQFHFIGNQAPNFEGYWGSIMKDLPSNVKVWGERSDVDKFMQACDVFMFNSTWECNPLVVRESVNYGMKILTRNLPQYSGMFDNYVTPIEGDVENISKQLLYLIESDDSYEIPMDDSFGQGLLDLYKEVSVLDITQQDPIENDYVIKQHFVVNPFFEILGQGGREFNIKLFDDKSLVYENNIKINSWVKLNREYYAKWKTEVRENNNLIYENVLDLEDKRVYISFGSKSLGDSLAWIPYCEEFRKKHNCELIVSTFLNDLFKDQYPNIEFVEPGKTVYDIYAQYQLGWFYNENGEFDSNKHPLDFRKQPLQKTVTDILGLDYNEIRPKLNLPKVEKKKKVGIGFHSTAQAKYWNNPDGWQSVIDHLDALGYECMIYSKEGDGYMNNFYPKGVTLFKGGNLQEVINDLVSCEFFIGLGSGLSWLAWACELPVILISGFSEKFAETKLDTYRVINEDVCHGCFNNDRLNAGDWNWCPLHKGTDRQFECSKQITSDMVIKEINKIMKKEKSFDWGTQNDWYIKTINKEIFENKIYERFFEVEKGDIVLDVGASLGPFTFSILNKNPKHVFCFEPCEEEFPTLVKNTVGNPVTHIMKGISNTNNVTQNNKLFNSVDGLQTEMESITFKKFINLYGIEKIDFLKTDCEGGEYDIFNDENYNFIKNNVKKISGEWHLNESYYKGSKEKFRKFRDTYLKNMNNHQVFSVDGVDIKWDLWNEHFIEYYNEVIIYIDNR